MGVKVMLIVAVLAAVMIGMALPTPSSPGVRPAQSQFVTLEFH
jgi:hypothetical protein